MESIEKFFTNFKAAIDDKGIQVQDIFNMDETGFRCGCGIVHCVVTRDARKALRLIDLDNRDYITSVECISAIGFEIPPLLILEGENILYK